MPTSTPSVGSLRIGAQQIVSSPGASVRLLARLYDPDNALLVASAVSSWSEYVIDRSAGDQALYAATGQIPASTVLGSSLTLDAKWTKDATGYVFSRLLQPAVALLMHGGHAHILRYEFLSTTYGVLRAEFGIET